MVSFSHIKEKIDDVVMLSPVAVGLVKLVVFTGFLINLLGGIW